MASRYRPDVVILDVNMLGMDGLQAERTNKKADTSPAVYVFPRITYC